MPESPYHIRVTAEEMDDFMAGRDASPRPQQAAATAERSPLWGSVPGLNAFGPAFAGRPAAGQVNVPTASRRAWPLLPLLLMLVVAGLLGVWRLRGEPSEPSANPAPVAALLAAPTVAPPPLPAPAGDAIPATLVVICDGAHYQLRSFRQLAALIGVRGSTWPHGCATDSAWWSAERQAAWAALRP